jgi:hypothetical protein
MPPVCAAMDERLMIRKRPGKAILQERKSDGMIVSQLMKEAMDEANHPGSGPTKA